MSDAVEQGRLAEKLSAAITAILDRHRTSIAPMLAANGGAVTGAALQNDAAVRRVAAFCYLLLPGLLRLALKEQTFIDFVMSHREQLLARLLEKSPAPSSGA